MKEKIEKFLDNSIALTITSWTIFIVGNIIYIANLIPQEWVYVYGMLIGASTIFFDYLAVDAHFYQKAIADFDAKHQAHIEEFEKLKKEYGIDDEE